MAYATLSVLAFLTILRVDLLTSFFSLVTRAVSFLLAVFYWAGPSAPAGSAGLSSLKAPYGPKFSRVLLFISYALRSSTITYC